MFSNGLRRLTIAIFLFVLSGTSLPASAQSWSNIINDNFQRANTLPGTAANSTQVTGPSGAAGQTYTPPGTKANYIDALGSIYYISGGTLCQSAKVGDSTPTHKLVRPASESALVVKESITTASYGGTTEDYYLLLHEQPTNTGLYCQVNFHGMGSAIAVGWHSHGTFSYIASSSFKAVAEHSYIISFASTGGGSIAKNCILSASIADAASPNVVVGTVTATNTASNDTNLAGTFGICTSGSFPIAGVKRWQTYQGSAISLSLLPTSVPVNSVAAISVTLSGGSTLNVGEQLKLTGSNQGSKPAVITTQKVTGATTAIITLSTGDNAQSLQITDPTNSISTNVSVVASDGQPPASVGLALVSSSPNTNIISIGANYGGTPPYTITLYRAEATPDNAGYIPPAAGTPVATQLHILAGITPANFIDTTVAAGHTYIYKALVKDSYSTPKSTASAPLYVKSWKAPIQILFIGDSITGYHDAAGNTPGSATVALISKQSRRIVKSIFRNVGGSASKNWVSGSTYLTAALTAAKQAFGTPDPVTNPVYVLCLLGTNDHLANVSAADYKANIISMDTVLVNSGYIVIHNQSPHSSHETEMQDKLELGYQEDLIKIANGTTVRLGDTTAWTYFSQHPEEFDDTALHPNAIGIQTYAQLWSAALEGYLK